MCVWVCVCVGVCVRAAFACEREMGREGEKAVPELQPVFQLVGADCAAPLWAWLWATWQPKKGALPGPDCSTATDPPTWNISFSFINTEITSNIPRHAAGSFEIPRLEAGKPLARQADTRSGREKIKW